VLGWPEVAPVHDGVSKPNKDEFKTSEEKFIKEPQYREKQPWNLLRFKFDSNNDRYYFTDFDGKRIPKIFRSAFVIIRTLGARDRDSVDEILIKELLDELKPEYDKAFNDLKNLLTSLSQNYDHNVKQQIIETIKHLNGILFDLYTANRSIINVATTLGSVYTDQERKQIFLNHYKITERNLQTFIIPELNNAHMKKSLNDLIEEYYPEVIKSWKKIAPPPNILKYNNDPYGSGRHISPNIVNITSTIALNLVCDIIDSSFHFDISKSNQAQQGYILYSSSIQSPPRAGLLCLSQ
jgi:hypothetical protein